MVLDYLLTHPELKQAANLMQGQNRSATKLIGKLDVATVVCFEIIKGHDEFVADEFFERGRHRAERRGPVPPAIRSPSCSTS